LKAEGIRDEREGDFIDNFIILFTCVRASTITTPHRYPPNSGFLRPQGKSQFEDLKVHPK
jgi:hypothetical protein